MTILTHPHRPTVSVASRLAAIGAAAAREARRQLAVVRLRRSLRRMPPAVLRDVGLERDDIAAFAAAHVDAEGRFCCSPLLR